MEQPSIPRKIAKALLRLLLYLGIGAIFGVLLALGTGAYSGITVDEGAERAGQITGMMVRLAFFVWIVGEIVRASKSKKTPSS